MTSEYDSLMTFYNRFILLWISYTYLSITRVACYSKALDNNGFLVEATRKFYDAHVDEYIKNTDHNGKPPTDHLEKFVSLVGRIYEESTR